MLPARRTSTIASLISRPFTRTTLALSSRRSYAQGYGDGKGDPKGESPQKQGSNPSADLEHPGPPPVAEGQGTGSGPTKGSSKGQKSPQSSPSSASPSSRGESKGGAQPKIHDERNGPAANGSTQADVDQHNRDFENRHDRAQAREDDKVDKGFWKGTGGVDKDP